MQSGAGLQPVMALQEQTTSKSPSAPAFDSSGGLKADTTLSNKALGCREWSRASARKSSAKTNRSEVTKLLSLR